MKLTNILFAIFLLYMDVPWIINAPKSGIVGNFKSEKECLSKSEDLIAKLVAGLHGSSREKLIGVSRYNLHPGYVIKLTIDDSDVLESYIYCKELKID